MAGEKKSKDKRDELNSELNNFQRFQRLRVALPGRTATSDHPRYRLRQPLAGWLFVTPHAGYLRWHESAKPVPAFRQIGEHILQFLYLGVLRSARIGAEGGVRLPSARGR
jgi:hypothetical protein